MGAAGGGSHKEPPESGEGCECGSSTRGTEGARGLRREVPGCGAPRGFSVNCLRGAVTFKPFAVFISLFIKTLPLPRHGGPPSGLWCCWRELGVPRDVCRTRAAFSVVGDQPREMFPCEGEGKASAISALIRLLFVFLRQNPPLLGEGCMCNQSLQSCPTLCDPMDSSPLGSSVHGILQARILEGVSMSSSRGSSQPRSRTCGSRVCCIGRRVLYR